MRIEGSLRLAAALASATLAIASCGGGSKAGGSAKHAAVLRVEVSIGTVDTVQAWAKEAQDLAGGALQLDVQPTSLQHQGVADIERRVIEHVRSGSVPIAVVGTRALDLEGVRTLQPLVAPFLIDSYDLERRVLASPLPTAMLRGTRRLNLVGVAVIPGPLRRMLGVRRAFHAPEDFRGAVVGFQQGGVAAKTMIALGARPRPLAPEIRLTGVDGIEQQLAAITGNNYTRQGRYVTTDLSFWPRTLVVLVNARAYARLDSAQRDALAKAARSALDAEMQSVRTDDQDGMRTFCSPAIRAHIQLVTSTPAQLAAMRRAVEPVYAEIQRSAAARTAIEQIRTMKRAAVPDKPPRCADAAPAARARERTQLDGVYVMDTKVSDVPKAVRANDPGSVQAENLGHWIYVLDRGRFAFTQRFRDSCTWGYGRFQILGHKVRWIFTDGGGIAPNNAVNRPGEDFMFSWSAYRDNLTFGPVKGKISPSNFDLKPWHRIARVPASRYLDARCPPPASWNAG